MIMSDDDAGDDNHDHRTGTLFQVVNDDRKLAKTFFADFIWLLVTAQPFKVCPPATLGLQLGPKQVCVTIVTFRIIE